MGNAAVKDLESAELGRAHLDSSSDKVIHSHCVTAGEATIRQRGHNWYEESNGKERFLFSLQRQGAFKGATQIVRNQQEEVLAVLKIDSKFKTERTLVYRPTPTFDQQQATPEVYKVKETDHPMYLYACIKSVGVSKCDATYSLLKVNEVYNDQDFAEFGSPIYKASKVSSRFKFAAAIVAGDDHSNLLGKVVSNGTAMEGEIADGVDIIAAVGVGMAVNRFGKSAGGLSGAGVV